MAYSLGVDLGTTYTTAAVSRDGHVEIVPLGDHSPQIPSVIFRSADGPMAFGEAAERHVLTEPDRVARGFKRRIADPTEILLGGLPVSAPALSQALLRWVVEQVSAGQGEPPERLKVTYPANWGPFKRDVMSSVLALDPSLDASLCSEPEAAAVHFASSGRVAVGDAVGVYDLGGGTFDAAVLERTDDGFALLGVAGGIDQLGGYDFDDAVFKMVTAGLPPYAFDHDDLETLQAAARLRRDCVEAKEALSSEPVVAVPVVVEGRTTSVRLTRREFEDSIRPLVHNTVEAFDLVVRRSGRTPADLQHVVLVGGSVKIPLVGEMLTDTLHRPLAASPQPKLSVAMGAARVAAGTVTPRTHAPVPAAPASARSVVEAPVAATPVIAAPVAPAPVVTTDEPIHPPAAGARHLPPWFRLTTIALLTASIVIAVFGPRVTAAVQLAWTPQLTAGSGRAYVEADQLKVELLGVGLPPYAKIPGSGQGFDLRSYRLWLAGSLHGQVSGPHADPVLLVPGSDWGLGRRLLTIPGAVMMLAALFSFAYAESLLRTIRRRRAGVRVNELFGVIGAGAIGGVVIAMASWIGSGRFLTVGAGVAVAVTWCAAIGLLVFGWDSPVKTSRLPRPPDS